ncbi:MAG: VIT and vWA domain-containing protein [Planctomycetota bacterium]|jgi:Ca-activated chloride channel family protein
MKRAKLICWAALLLACTFSPALADGFIVLRPPRPDIVPIPLAVKYHHVKVDVDDQIAVTTVDQVFVNPNRMRLEGTYIFPLPEGAAVSEMSMWINGKEMAGEMLPRDEANKIYTDIVRSMKDPAILEYLGSRMFRMRIFPIEPGEEKRVKIEYTERLEQDSGLVTYRYPLSTEKFSSQPLDEVLIDMNVRSAVPLKSLFSPSHDVDVFRKSDHHAQVSYEAKRVTPDKDFVLYYGLSRERFGATLVASKSKTKDGYFALFLAPNFEIDEQEILPKDVVFVVDTSGSMKEPARKPWKIDQVKDALRFCINSLNPRDRFNIVAFSTGTRSYRSVLQALSDDVRAEAFTFIDSLDARGGTNIHEALKTALAMNTGDESRPFVVVFLTDGLPTVGDLQKPEDLVDFARKNAGQQTRLFAFGVGYDVNTHLLDRLAQENRGDRIYVSPEESIEVKVSAFYDKISCPVLSDIKLAIDQVETYDLYPIEVPDLFRGSQLVIYGRYKGSGHAAIRVKGAMQGERSTFVYEANFPLLQESHSQIPRLWATSKIGYLLDQLRLKGIDVTSGQKPQGSDRELMDEIVTLATEFGIVTPYTAMLVLEDTRTNRRPPTPAARVFLNASEDAEFSKEVSDKLESLGYTTGKASVKLSKAAREMQRGYMAPGAGGSTVFNRVIEPEKTFKQVGDKTFVLVHGVWQDSLYTEGMETRKVKFLSQDYFDLIQDESKLARYFSAGDRVVVLFKGEAIEIVL